MFLRERRLRSGIEAPFQHRILRMQQPGIGLHYAAARMGHGVGAYFLSACHGQARQEHGGGAIERGA